jgi:hypothetical protein
VSLYLLFIYVYLQYVHPTVSIHSMCVDTAIECNIVVLPPSGCNVVILPLQIRWFQVEVLQAMEKNVKLDEEYIDVSIWHVCVCVSVCTNILLYLFHRAVAGCMSWR